MKHIDKNQPIGDFLDFVQNENPINWNDIHHSQRHPNLYRDCRDTILVCEQNGLGGYTERPLMNASDLHIDHYRKKGMNWPHDVSFDWNNLVVESRNPGYGACYKDNLTRNIADYNSLLNPMIDYPEEMITYLSNGEMVVRDGLNEATRDKVIFTIGRFNLNHQLLSLNVKLLLDTSSKTIQPSAMMKFVRLLKIMVTPQLLNMHWMHVVHQNKQSDSWTSLVD